MVWIRDYFLFFNFLSCTIESIINNKRKSKIININKPIVEVDYELGGKSIKELEKILKKYNFI